MKFIQERGYDVEIEKDGTIVFYKKLSMFATVFYLKSKSLILYRSDMKAIQISLSAEGRRKLKCPSAVIQYANAYITKNNPKWG